MARTSEAEAAKLQELVEIGAEYGVEVEKKLGGEYVLRGRHLAVSYWPFLPRRPAYVLNTTREVPWVDSHGAVRMAISKPPIQRFMDKDKRRAGSYRSERKRLLEQDNRCYWCGKKLTLKKSTLEHKIPLARGGLDERSNWALACLPCNSRRGHDMPELK